MTTAQSTFAFYCVDEAGMRAWGASLSALLDAAGLTKTADTGQVDWATVAKPAGASTLIGYEIRTIPDSVGTLRLKILYETGSNTSGQSFRLGTSVGTGSDGAGALTGVLHANRYSSPTNTASMNSALVFPSYAASWDGGFFFATAPAHTASANYRHMHAFDRTCDAAGAVDDKGSIHLSTNVTSATSTVTAYGYSKDLGVEAIFYSFPARLHYPYAGSVPSYVSSLKRPFAIARHMTPAPRWHKNVLVASAVDAPLGAVLSANVLGSVQSYLSLGATWGAVNGYPVDNLDVSGTLLLRWE